MPFLRRWSLPLFIFFRWSNHFSGTGVLTYESDHLFQMLTLCFNYYSAWIRAHIDFIKFWNRFCLILGEQLTTKACLFCISALTPESPLDNCLFAVISIYLKGLITGSQLKISIYLKVWMIFSHSFLQRHILCSILAIMYFLRALALILFGLPHVLLIL